MSNTKHTPGPWVVEPLDPCENTECDNHCTDYGYGVYTRDGITLDEVDANASLIAAAPELLEALKDAREELFKNTNTCYETGCKCEGNEESKQLMDRVEAAIAKAEGNEE